MTRGLFGLIHPAECGQPEFGQAVHIADADPVPGYPQAQDGGRGDLTDGERAARLVCRDGWRPDVPPPPTTGPYYADSDDEEGDGDFFEGVGRVGAVLLAGFGLTILISTLLRGH